MRFRCATGVAASNHSAVSRFTDCRSCSFDIGSLTGSVMMVPSHVQLERVLEGAGRLHLNAGVEHRLLSPTMAPTTSGIPSAVAVLVLTTKGTVLSRAKLLHEKHGSRARKKAD
jgi:hypothetical protein